MRRSYITSFTLTGLVAPLGILGAETGAGYGWQEPRATSRLLSLFSFLTGGFRNGARPFLFVTLCRSVAVSSHRAPTLRNVTGSICPMGKSDFVTLRNGIAPSPTALPLRGTRIVTRRVTLTRGLSYRGRCRCMRLTLREPVNVNGTISVNDTALPLRAGTAPLPSPPPKPKATSTRSVETRVRQHAPFRFQSTLENQEGGPCSTPL